jgi:hypothetical protein
MKYSKMCQNETKIHETTVPELNKNDAWKQMPKNKNNIFEK